MTRVNARRTQGTPSFAWEEDAMDWKRRKRPLMGLVGGLGVVAALAGLVGGFYSPTTSIVLAFGIWIIGATLVNVLIP
jgi:hypothetical protein